LGPGIGAACPVTRRASTATVAKRPATMNAAVAERKMAWKKSPIMGLSPPVLTLEENVGRQ